MPELPSYEEYMKASIMAALIARYVHDHMQRGLGAPSVDDMRRFNEESSAIAELWEESLELE